MIELRSLTKRYGPVLAVDDLTVTIRPGRVTGLIGPNGAGKTTTLRMILGLVAPTRGTATTGGRRYADLPSPMRQVGALLHPHAPRGRRRVYDHLHCLARSNGIPRWRVDEVLQLVGLDGVAGRRTRALSLGMSQRLGIAVTLLGDPEMLVFDEPVCGLDPDGIVWVRSLLRNLAGQGRTVLISSHLMNELTMVADHFVIIGRGRLIADSSAEDLMRAFARQRVLVRCDDPRFLAGRLTELGARVRPCSAGGLMVYGVETAEIHHLATVCGVGLHELTPQRPSLEEIFLDLTQDSAEYDVTTGAA